MIRLACKIPRKVTLACSGGRDSMSSLEFLVRGHRDVTVAYYNHGTHHGYEAYNFLLDFCQKQNLKFVHDVCRKEAPPRKSKEEFWREQRYEFFKRLKQPIVMCHHLEDAVEWWIFSSLRGRSNLIPVERTDPHILRPFLLTHKEDLHSRLNSYPHVEDPSNTETYFSRNFIRHNLTPLCLEVNPGLHKTIRKLYERK